MRGLAAVLVLLGHVLDDGVHFGLENLGPAAWSVWSAGVDIFFVISGFIMIWTFGRLFGQDGAAFDFMVRRLIRIVPLYWIMTSLTALALVFLPSLFDRAQFSFQHYVMSLVFLPHESPGGGMWPILGVGWTLNYEMFFYLVFAVGLAFRVGLGLSVVFGTLGVTFLGARLLDLPAVPAVHFLANSVMLEFLAGVGLGLLVRPYGLSRWCLVVTAGVALLVGAALSAFVSGEARFVRAGLPALAVLSLALALRPAATGLLGRWALAIGAASYALYLSHILVINVLKASMVGPALAAGLPPGLAFGSYAVLAVTFSLATALLLHRYVEQPIQRLCRRGANLIAGDRASRPDQKPPGATSVIGPARRRLTLAGDAGPAAWRVLERPSAPEHAP